MILTSVMASPDQALTAETTLSARPPVTAPAITVTMAKTRNALSPKRCGRRQLVALESPRRTAQEARQHTQRAAPPPRQARRS